MTLCDAESPEFKTHRERTAERLGIRILFIEQSRLLDLFWVHARHFE